VTVPPNRDLAKSEQRLKSMVANRVTRWVCQTVAQNVAHFYGGKSSPQFGLLQ
jgi:hypothetical protein